MPAPAIRTVARGIPPPVSKFETRMVRIDRLRRLTVPRRAISIRGVRVISCGCV